MKNLSHPCLQAFVGSAGLAKLTEAPMAAGQNWALNVTVFLEPDTMAQVSLLSS